MLRKISVVIPVYNRKAQIISTVKSIYCCNYLNFEVIIVDDGSTEDLSELKKFKDLIYIKQKNSGPGIARNTGVKEATGEIIAFTDSDCIVSKDWLRIINESLKNKVGIVGGKTIEIEEKGILKHINILGGEVEAENNPFCSTNNMGILKKAFDDVKGFDAYFDFAAEDIDLCIRVQSKGYMLMPQKDMIINHKHLRGLKGLMKARFKSEQGLIKLINKHPSMGRLYPHYLLVIPIISLRDSINFIIKNKKSLWTLPLLYYIFFLCRVAGFLGKLSFIFLNMNYVKYLFYIPKLDWA